MQVVTAQCMLGQSAAGSSSEVWNRQRRTVDEEPTRLVASSEGVGFRVMTKEVPLALSPSVSWTFTSFPRYAVSFSFVCLHQSINRSQAGTCVAN